MSEEGMTRPKPFIRWFHPAVVVYAAQRANPSNRPYISEAFTAAAHQSSSASGSALTNERIHTSLCCCRSSDARRDAPPRGQRMVSESKPGGLILAGACRISRDRADSTIPNIK
uniref:Uncharacterized protein n=1 Tax=Plectus sambesii TaxID=2011161 RepID=A0A914VE84_9BILA